MTLADLAAEAAALCRLAAPIDLGETPVYVVPQSSLPPAMGRGSFCLGYTTPALDLFLRPHLGGAWQGRGACMVINDVEAAAFGPAHLRRLFLGVVIHELVHIIEEFLPSIRAAVEPSPAAVESANLSIAAYLSRPAERVRDWGEQIYRTHGLQFLRAALHLRHRVQALTGLNMSAARVIGPVPLSHPDFYAKRLGDEPARLAGLSLTAIAKLPAPPAFVALYAADKLEFQQRQTKEIAHEHLGTNFDRPS
jgi:hypothetical protein